MKSEEGGILEDLLEDQHNDRITNGEFAPIFSKDITISVIPYVHSVFAQFILLKIDEQSRFLAMCLVVAESTHQDVEGNFMTNASVIIMTISLSLFLGLLFSGQLIL